MDIIKIKVIPDNCIDQSKTLMNWITFNKNNWESKENNEPMKKLKTNWEDKTYSLLIAGISKEDLDKRIVARGCAIYDVKGQKVYMYWKNITIEAVDLDNKIGIDYQKSPKIWSNTTLSNGFICNRYNSRGEPLFYQTIL